MVSQREFDELKKTAEKFEADYKRLLARIAELEPKPVRWVALKAAPRGNFSYNTIRVWVAKGIIKSQRRGGRLYVDAESLRDHLAMLAA
jgi:hypothetical protein